MSSKKTVDEEIQHILCSMENMSVSSEEYMKASINLERLYKCKSSVGGRLVSPDILITAITNLAGILLVLNYEQAHVVTTRAINLILRGRM